ncbi:MAG: hypothetical protein Q8P22_04565 [Chloroflexota bacterium]|nr:hypothetical protein [Chloroflexota bacterium]
MRLPFLLATLSLPLLALLAACAGDGGRAPEEGAFVQDPQAVVLGLSDLPASLMKAGDFMKAPDSGHHITNDESCGGSPGAEGTATPALSGAEGPASSPTAAPVATVSPTPSGTPSERATCLRDLEEWGRLDGYQVEYRASAPNAFYAGTYDIFNAASIYKDAKGADAAFRNGQERLQESLKELEEAEPVDIPLVGDESLAFVVTSTQKMEDRDISVSLHVVDFRRGNVLVRVGTTAPTALASVDDPLTLARQVDERILRVAGQPSGTSTPTATAAP